MLPTISAFVISLKHIHVTLYHHANWALTLSIELDTATDLAFPSDISSVCVFQIAPKSLLFTEDITIVGVKEVSILIRLDALEALVSFVNKNVLMIATI